ncbi:15175_t:CDS:10 [Gigaspora margarita]|uniref:15175_t:CDS:1 n=1 Tax=Gigaspora margarita TaxID=4874 RepID=A0ABN7UFR0_GIGMA|nr:15175_t:CDS:10 [Gigaspora margarita]
MSDLNSQYNSNTVLLGIPENDTHYYDTSISDNSQSFSFENNETLPVDQINENQKRSNPYMHWGGFDDHDERAVKMAKLDESAYGGPELLNYREPNLSSCESDLSLYGEPGLSSYGGDQGLFTYGGGQNFLSYEEPNFSGYDYYYLAPFIDNNKQDEIDGQIPLQAIRPYIIDEQLPSQQIDEQLPLQEIKPCNIVEQPSLQMVDHYEIHKQPSLQVAKQYEVEDQAPLQDIKHHEIDNQISLHEIKQYDISAQSPLQEDKRFELSDKSPLQDIKPLEIIDQLSLQDTEQYDVDDQLSQDTIQNDFDEESSLQNINPFIIEEKPPLQDIKPTSLQNLLKYEVDEQSLQDIKPNLQDIKPIQQDIKPILQDIKPSPTFDSDEVEVIDLTEDDDPPLISTTSTALSALTTSTIIKQEPISTTSLFPPLNLSNLSRPLFPNNNSLFPPVNNFQFPTINNNITFPNANNIIPQNVNSPIPSNVNGNLLFNFNNSPLPNETKPNMFENRQGSYSKSINLQDLLEMIPLDESNKTPVNEAMRKINARRGIVPGLSSIKLMDHQVIGVSWMVDQEIKDKVRGGILADDMGLGKNHIDDLYPYFRFLEISNFSDWQTFHEQFSSGSQRAIQRAQTVLRGFLLRRTKESKLDGKPLLVLPDKSVSFVKQDFSQDEREFYDALEKRSRIEFNRYLKEGSVLKNYAYILVMLLRLRQACNHPFLTQEDIGHIISLAGDSRLPHNSSNSNCLDKDLPTQLERAKKILSDKVITRLYDQYKNSSSNDDCPICYDLERDFISLEVFIPPVKKETQDDDDDNELPTMDEVISSSFTGSDDSLFTSKEEDPKKDIDATNNNATNNTFANATEGSFLFSTKINQLMKELAAAQQEDPGCKTIVFSQWTSMLDLVEKPIKEAGYKFCRYDGTMDVKERDNSLRQLTQDNEVTIMLVSLKAGGVGLNLTKANRVIMLDCWWNPAVEDQAIDRVHRIGQFKNVIIKRLTIKDTIEDRILILQDKKRELAAGALGEGSIKVGRLTVEDLIFLFR